MHLHRALRRGRAAAALLLVGAVAGACGGGADNSEACGVFRELQGSLRAASVDASGANLAAVEADLSQLGRAAGGDRKLSVGAARARTGWSEFRRASQAVPRNEFAVRQAYNEALAPLAAFTEACP